MEKRSWRKIPEIQQTAGPGRVVHTAGYSLAELFFNYFPDAVEGPVNLLAGDDQRRGDADHAIVRLLAEDALLLQRLAIGARRAVHLDADPQAPAADFAQ